MYNNDPYFLDAKEAAKKLIVCLDNLLQYMQENFPPPKGGRWMAGSNGLFIVFPTEE